MKLNFFSSSSILRNFLVFNFIVFLVLGIFTFLYLSSTKPDLVKKRSNQHSIIINNTTDHINRLNVDFTKNSIDWLQDLFIVYTHRKYFVTTVIY